MKKVVSFCIFSMLLALLNIGVKAQTPSGLVMDPANLPTPMVINQYDTVYLSPTGCFELLGLHDTDKVSIEWEVLFNGQRIPDGQLSDYFNEFVFQSRYTIGQTDQWCGKTYVSTYCGDGNGYGSFPGAYTPIYGTELGYNCERVGHFLMGYPFTVLNGDARPLNVPFEFDYFYVKFFRDTLATAHRLVYNAKEQGTYQFVFNLYKRCNGTEWDQVYVGSNERYKVGGHQSVLCGLLSSDTLQGYTVSEIKDYYRCVGDTLVLGNPEMIFTTSTDTTVAPGYDSVFYMGVSSCGGSIDSIVRFRVFFEDPAVPVLDTLNSTLAVCDSGNVSILVTLENADQCIWYDANDNVIDTLDVTDVFTQFITANTEFYAYGYNSASGCASSDSLRIFTEVFASPNPVVSVDTTKQCLNGSFTFSINATYDSTAWFHGSTEFWPATVPFTQTATMENAGDYYAVVADTNVSIYNVDVPCSATSNTVTVEVFSLPEVTLTQFNGVATDTNNAGMFCPLDTIHTATFVVSGGKTPYTLTWMTTPIADDMAVVDDSVYTLTIHSTTACNTVYTNGIIAGVDDNNCALTNTADITFTINDTIKPVLTVVTNTVEGEPAGTDCKYIVPDVTTAAFVTATDNCDSVILTQTPAAGTLITDTTMVVVTVTDMCGNSVEDSVQVTIPEPVDVTATVTQHVICSGDANGEIEVAVAHGVHPYSVTITDGTTNYTQTGGNVDTTFTFTGLTKGVWKVTVTDNNGCVDSTEADVTAPDALTLTVSDQTNLRCWNDNSGSFNYQVTGGSAPYYLVITLNGTQVSDSTLAAATTTQIAVTGLAAGDYKVKVTDDHGCKDSSEFTLTQPDSLQITSTGILNNVRCYGENNGNATVNVTGGTLPYVYSWKDNTDTEVSNQQTTGRILYAGAYTIHVTDANNCPCVDSIVTITQHDSLQVVSLVDSTQHTACPYLGDYSFTATVSGGTETHTFHWTVSGVDTPDETTTDLTDTYTYTEAPAICDTTLSNIMFYVVDDSLCRASSVNPFDLHIVDDENPTITGTLPDTIVDGCDENAATIPAAFTTIAELENAGLTFADNCTAVADLVVTSADVAATASCPLKATITRTYTITDKCNKFATISHTISVQDTTKPTFDAPDDITIYKDSSCNYSADLLITGTATNLADNCPLGTQVASYTDVEAAGDCIGKTIITRTWHFEDVCGNAAEDQDQIITVLDTIKPWFTLEPKNDSIACNLFTIGRLQTWLDKPRATDNCSDVKIVIDTLTVDTTCRAELGWLYTHNFRFTAVDSCGNQTVKEASYALYDKNAPTWDEFPIDSTVKECDVVDLEDTIRAWASNISWTDPALAGSCSDSVEFAIIDSALFTPTCGAGSSAGIYKYKWSLTDGCLVRVDSARFFIVDHTRPVINPVPATIYVECDGQGNQDEFKQWLKIPQATDNCSEATLDSIKYIIPTGGLNLEYDLDTVTVVDAAGHFNGFIGDQCEGYYFIVWYFSDACGNVNTTQERFYIIHNDGPEFTVIPQDTTIQCEDYNISNMASWLATPQAHDVCMDQDVPVNNNLATAVFIQGSCGATGRYNVSFTAADDCANSTTVTARVIIIDTVAPTVTTDLGTDLSDSTLYYSRLDNCTEPVPTDYTTTVGDIVNNHIAGILSFNDCSVKNSTLVVVAVEELLNETACTKTYNVSYTIEDECGNENVFYQNVMVTDTTTPTGNNIASATIALDASCALLETVPTYTSVAELNGFGANVVDCPNAADLTVALDGADTYDGSLANCDSVIIRHYILTDACGQTLQIADTIKVIDTLAPVLTYSELNDTVYSREDCGEIADTVALFANLLDYAYLTANYNFTAEDCTPNYTITRGTSTVTEGPWGDTKIEKTVVTTFSISDGSLCNTKTTEFEHTLVILDTVTPKLPGTPIKDSTIQQLADCSYNVPDEAYFDKYEDVQAWDNSFVVTDCHVGPNSTVNHLGTDTLDLGCTKTLSLHYVVLDSCNNASEEFILTIHVEDTVAPVLAGSLTDSICYYNTDCSLPVVAPYQTANELLANGITSITECNLDYDAVRVSLVSADTSTERCPVVVTRIYTLSDDCGNVSKQFNHVIRILDTVRPVVLFDHVDTTKIYLDAVSCTSPAVDTFKTVQDVMTFTGLPIENLFRDCNIGPDCEIVLVSVDSSDARCPRNIDRLYAVVDSCGNQSNGNFRHTITVIDNVAPTITGNLADSTIYMTEDCVIPNVEPYATVDDLPSTIEIFDCNLDQNLTWIDDTLATAAQITLDHPEIMIIIRTYTTTDSCGNPDDFTHIIFVRDTFAPTINTDYTTVGGEPKVQDSVIQRKADCTFELPTAFATVEEAEAYPGMNDIFDCQLDSNLTLVSQDTVLTNCVDTVTRVYSVQDSTGNTSYFTQIFFINDTVKPVASGTLPTLNIYTDVDCDYSTSLADEITPYANVSDLATAGLTVTDCKNLTVSAPADVEHIDIYNCNSYLTRTYTITDDCGNYITVEQTININDTIKPQLSAVIPNQPATSEGDCTFTIPDLTSLVLSAFDDNCSSAAKTCTQDYAAATVITDTTDVTVTFTDSCNNSNTVVIRVTVPSTPVIVRFETDSVRCHGESNGSIEVFAEGGTTPYRYTIEGTTDTISTTVFTDLAAGNYTVTMIDADGCKASKDTTVYEPDTLDVTLTLNNAAVCDYEKIYATANITEPGTPSYTYSWSVLHLDVDTTSLAGETTALTSFDTNYLAPAGDYKFVVNVVDARTCVATDTVSYRVDTSYLIDTAAWVCFNEDYVWEGHRTISIAERPVTDTTYIFYDSLLTVNNCDSVVALHLWNISNPALVVRHQGEGTAMPDLLQTSIDTTVYTDGPTFAFEFFVSKICSGCSNIKVSVDFDWAVDTGSNDWAPMGNNVTSYLWPTYHTYFDASTLQPYTNATPDHVSLPKLFPTVSAGGTAHNYDYYNLCWLAPSYANYHGTGTSSYGTFYSYGRAHTLQILNHDRTPGRYRVIVSLHQRLNGSGYNNEGYDSADGKIGGHGASDGPIVYASDTVYITILQGANSVMPHVDPMDGVVSSTEKDVLPIANVYPNPAKDYIEIELSGFEGETQIGLVDGHGKTLQSVEVDIDSESTPIVKMNTSDYAAGVYMVTARSKDVIVTKRVVIVK
ncbi:MAG: T9SS type A sorting domain-containing protein [Bacteroidales bacterium]|nr:T9SS type A sorting domain-containing protein [Bacteroidales bacterium]